MRIGIMLRSLDEQGGIGVYTRYLTEELLSIDHENRYVLFYRSPSHIGRYSHHTQVVERVIQAPNKALWDQVAIPLACWKEKIDVAFHPKFTVPLLAPCKSVMVLHGAGWFMPDTSKFWSKTDLRYLKTVMPLYCRRAAAVLSVSEVTTDTFNSVFNLPAQKIRTVYFGPGKHFRPVRDPSILENIRQKYMLPDQFILTLSGYNKGQRKNIAGILKAYELFHGATPHKLVIGGKDCAKFKTRYAIPDDGYGRDVLFTDWIDQEDLPALYSLADVYLYPSYSEAFPIPLTEAMACGTPIITSNLNGLAEIAGNAAILVDPDDTQDIAGALRLVLTNADVKERLSVQGRERSANFTWEKCAQTTLSIIKSLN